MPLVREIVRILMNPAADGLSFRFANYHEAVRTAKVKIGNDLEFTPAAIDWSIAKLLTEIEGVVFLKESRTSRWRPENEDFVLGVGCFVDSAAFADFGYTLTNRKDKAECQEVTLRIISELIDRQLNYDRLYSAGYYDCYQTFQPSTFIID